MADVCWRIETTRVGWTGATLTFRYVDSEIPGMDESLLTLYQAPALDGPWTQVTTQAVDEARNQISATVTASGYFAMRDRDTIQPAVTIEQAPAQADPTNAFPIVFDAVFSDPVLGFDETGVMAGGTATGAVIEVTGTGAAYSISVTSATGDGTVEPYVSAGACTDLVGNPNLASTSEDNSVTLDREKPSVLISSSAPNPTNMSPIPVAVTFSKPVTGFDEDDVDLENGSLTNFLGSETDYTFDLTPEDQGSVEAEVPEGVAIDAAGNINSASTSLVREYDSLPPTCSILLVDPSHTTADEVSFSVMFSEDIGDSFQVGDIGVTGSLAAGAEVQLLGPAPLYTVVVRTSDPDDDGTVGITVGAGITDLAGNGCVPAASEMFRLHNWFGFTLHPEDAWKYAGDTHAFSVDISCGNSAPQFQWKWKDKENNVHGLPGNSPQCTLSELTTEARGDYWCEVEYDGSVYSSNTAMLDVAPRISITEQPHGDSRKPGESYEFYVVAEGGYPELSYEWIKDGIYLPEATEDSLSLTDLEEDDSGSYQVQIMDAQTDVILSEPAELVVSSNVPAASFTSLLVLAAGISGGVSIVLRRKRGKHKRL